MVGRISAPRLDVDRSPLVLALVHRLLEIDPVEGVRETIVEGVGILAKASFVRLWEMQDDVFVETTCRGDEPEPAAVELERRLLDLRGPARSTLERHGDPELDRLSAWYRGEGRLCRVTPLRAFGGAVGALAFHCANRSELLSGELEALRRYPESAGVALRNAHLRAELRRLAYIDPLTGLANRRAIDDRLEEFAAGVVSVLFVDFDGLKRINDLLGYEAGDGVIRAVGEALRGLESPNWFPGRLGGDEFVVLLPGAEADRARVEAAVLASRLDDLEVPDAAASQFGGASVGWATAERHEDKVTLLRRAANGMRAEKTRRRELKPPSPGRL